MSTAQEGAIPSGCAFRDRCSYAQDACAAAVPLLESVGADRAVACRRWRDSRCSPRRVIHDASCILGLS